jgi:hypothetical protein
MEFDGPSQQWVKQTFRVSCPPVIWGRGEEGPVHRPPEALTIFFFELLSSDHFSYRIWCLGQIM